MPSASNDPHQGWDAVSTLPAAARITRRVVGKRQWEFVDDDGVIQSGQTLKTVRWLPQRVGIAGKRKYKERGEAVIAPDVDFPVPQILLAAYAFALFDSNSTWVEPY